MLNPYIKEMLMPIERISIPIMFRVSSCRPGAQHTVPIAYSIGDGKWSTCEGVWNITEDFRQATYCEEQLIETDFGDKWKPTEKKLPRYAIRQVSTPFDRRSTLRWLQNIDKAEPWVQALLFVALMVPVPQDDYRSASILVAQQNAVEWMRETTSINKTVVLSDEHTIAPLEFWTVGMRLSYYQQHSKMLKMMSLDVGQNELLSIFNERKPEVGYTIPFGGNITTM